MTQTNLEIEGKILDIAPADVIQRLKELGAIFKGEFHYNRYVFDTHPAVKSRWIRLRTDGTQTTLTAKEIQNDTTTGTSEWEVEVSDLETTLTILEKLALNPSRCKRIIACYFC